MTPSGWSVGALVAAALAGAPEAAGSDYPSRALRMVVPAAPGGGSDAAARIVGTRLGERLGQMIVIDNRPGAAGVMGSSIVAKAPADGYTFILSDMPHAINVSVRKNVPYDAVKDFTPISLIGTTPLLLVVNPRVPAQTVSELVSLAKGQPRKLNLASGGNGTATHLVGELFKLETGTVITHVPYRSSGLALGEVVGGQIQGMFATSRGPSRT